MDLTPPSKAFAEPRTLITATLAGIVLFALMVFAAPPAFADEFAVGILLDSANSDSTDSTFMDGFQLAVDQSPDVSHPPGAEGGDHLGSMDVILIVVDNATRPEEFLAAAVDLIEREGVAIIVADVSPDVLAALFGPITESEAMLIVMSDTGGAEFSATRSFFAAPEQDGLEVLLTDQNPTFEDAFVSAYSLSPSASATRGYLAGRLVDISVEATDRDPYDEQALAKGLADATRPPSVSSDVDAGSSETTALPNPKPGDTTAPITLAEKLVESGTSSGVGGGFTVAIVVALAATAGLGFRASRRRRSSSIGG